MSPSRFFLYSLAKRFEHVLCKQVPHDDFIHARGSSSLALTNYLTMGIALLCSLIVAMLYSADLRAAQGTLAFSELKAYGHFSNAAYGSRQEIGKAVSELGYTLTKTGTIAGAEVNYFLATNEEKKRQLIAIRGTSNVENALLDVAIKFTENSQTGVRLHEGFAYAGQEIFKAIKPQLNTAYQIETTGHSLGGAVAMVLAMYLDANKYNVGNVVTFGQPKVTNIPGALKYKHLAVTRVVTPGDLVPLVPPLDPLDMNNIDVYWHLGDELILLPGKEYSRIGVAKSMLRATKIFGKPLSEENLHNHMMQEYLGLIGKKILEATEVPYKNDFSILKWFGSAIGNNDEQPKSMYLD